MHELLHAIVVVRLIFGAAPLSSIVLAVRAIRRRDFASHGIWMTRAYAIALGAGSQVFTMLPSVLIVGPIGAADELPRTVLMTAGCDQPRGGRARHSPTWAAIQSYVNGCGSVPNGGCAGRMKDFAPIVAMTGRAAAMALWTGVPAPCLTVRLMPDSTACAFATHGRADPQPGVVIAIGLCAVPMSGTAQPAPPFGYT